VRSVNCVEVDIDLGFGISVKKTVVLEGIDRADIPKTLVSKAKHCLVVLLGGKNILIHIDDEQKDGHLYGRVFLDQKVFGDPEGLIKPFGLDEPRLEVSTFYAWLKDQGFDIVLVKNILNGNGRA
jgi:hypothetical protein